MALRSTSAVALPRQQRMRRSLSISRHLVLHAEMPRHQFQTTTSLYRDHGLEAERLRLSDEAVRTSQRMHGSKWRLHHKHLHGRKRTRTQILSLARLAVMQTPLCYQ